MAHQWNFEGRVIDKEGSRERGGVTFDEQGKRAVLPGFAGKGLEIREV